MRWAWIIGGLYVLIGGTLLFGALHPLRDALDAHALHLLLVGATYQAIQGLALLLLGHAGTGRIAAILIAAGTGASCAMLYLIIFTGAHPFDALAPVGGVITFLGWIALLVAHPRGGA